MLTRAPRLVGFLLSLALGLGIIGAKFSFIHDYGSDLPFWDQWDGEAERLYLPYLNGELRGRDLLRPHNEHRIASTRLLFLTLFELGDRQWDARVQIAVNAGLHTATALLLFALAWRILPPSAAIAFAGAIFVFFTSSVSWENTLSGFQSSFYFVCLFSIGYLAAALFARPRTWVWWLSPVIGAAALLSLGSGLLAPAAVVGVVVLRLLRDRKLTWQDAWVGGSSLLLLGAGFLLKVDVPEHAVLKAKDFSGWLEAWLRQLAWPLRNPWGALLFICPTLALTNGYFRRRLDNATTPFLLGAIAWFALQTAAIAYARGGENHGYASRYYDSLALGILLNFLVLAYLTRSTTRRWTRAAGIAAVAFSASLIFWRLHREVVSVEHTLLRGLPSVNATRTQNVRAYVRERDPAFFEKTPWTELPFPSASYLARLLDQPTLRAFLPESVRPALGIRAEPEASQGFFETKVYSRPGPAPRDLSTYVADAEGEARFLSAPFAVDHSRVSLFIAGEGNASTDFRLVDDRGAILRPLGSSSPVKRWKRVNFAVQDNARYRLEATKSGSGWLAFTAPFTTTPQTAFVAKMVQASSWIIGAGGTLGFMALVLLACQRHKQRIESPSRTESPNDD